MAEPDNVTVWVLSQPAWPQVARAAPMTSGLVAFCRTASPKRQRMDPSLQRRAQFASVTPKLSSITSERRNPGVKETAAMPCGVSSGSQ